MSVKATNWAWHQSPTTIKGNNLIVLMALADISDDEGRCIYGADSDRRQRALAKKARLSVRTFQRVIKELVDTHGVVAMSSNGRTPNYNLDFSVVRPPEDEETRQSDALAPVDNLGDSLSLGDSSGGSDTPTVSPHRNILTKDLNQSSLEQLTDAGALRADGDFSQPRLGIADRLRSASARRHLNVLELNDKLGHIFDEVAGRENSRRIVYLVAKAILGKAAKAKTDLSDPTRYVITAVQNETEVWRKYAFGLDPRS